MNDIRAVARVCRMADDQLEGHLDVLRDLFAHTGRAWIVGVTGTPGAGKSSLCDRLIQHWRQAGKRIGVVAVDPTSPFSGGAILGDRIRMQRHFDDSEVFIRSVATRGALGGLSRSCFDIVRVLDAWGAHIVLVETVGVGQDELEVTQSAHTTLIVMAPGLGDDVQAIKAGLLECADVFVVNKADRDGADATVRDLELMIALGEKTFVPTFASPLHVNASGSVVHQTEQWTPPIVRTVATQNQGVRETIAALERHHAWLNHSEPGAQRLRQRHRAGMYTQMRNALMDAALREVSQTIDELVQQVAERHIDPYAACEALIATFRSRH